MSEEFSFMNEKIKEKPFYKKKWVQIVAATIVLAAVFGVVAGGVFATVTSALEKKQQSQQMEEIEIPKDHPVSGEENSVGEEVPEATQAPVEIHEMELTAEDWGKLYGKLMLVAKDAGKSLVTVTAIRNDVDWFDEAYENSGQASGMIIGDNGVELLILTKYDAVKDYDALRITFADDTVIFGNLKKYDAATGFAVVSVNLSDIPKRTEEHFAKAALGKSIHLTGGEPVIIMGKADGSENSVSVGMVTSIHKSQSVVDGEYTVLVTDRIKTSGADGVVLNLQGQVVGILTSKQLVSGTENVLCAYGISDVKGLMEHLSNNQDVTYLGIRGVGVTAEAKEQGIPSGVYVTEVLLDSPAMLGGIQAGDILQKMNGQKLETMSDVSRVLQKLSNKQNITLEGRRLTKDGYKQVQYETTLSVLE